MHNNRITFDKTRGRGRVEEASSPRAAKKESNYWIIGREVMLWFRDVQDFLFDLRLTSLPSPAALFLFLRLRMHQTSVDATKAAKARGTLLLGEREPIVLVMDLKYHDHYHQATRNGAATKTEQEEHGLPLRALCRSPKGCRGDG